MEQQSRRRKYHPWPSRERRLVTRARIANGGRRGEAKQRVRSINKDGLRAWDAEAGREPLELRAEGGKGHDNNYDTQKSLHIHIGFAPCEKNIVTQEISSGDLPSIICAASRR
jgi:hypothetical protein